jgi:hypothetical protein
MADAATAVHCRARERGGVAGGGAGAAGGGAGDWVSQQDTADMARVSGVIAALHARGPRAILVTLGLSGSLHDGDA